MREGSVIVKCEPNNLAQIIQYLKGMKHVTVNIYVQTIGNISNSTVTGVNQIMQGIDVQT